MFYEVYFVKQLIIKNERQALAKVSLIKFKDAMSVSLYPFNRSHILQYVKYTK